MFKYKKSRLSAFFAAINIVLADIGGKKTTYIISFRAKSIIIMSVSVVMLVACERHASTSEQMDIAEKLMNTKPDSALTILNSIHASGFKGKDAAKYALLKSMALDKNCIDTTTFDILEPAIDYCIKNGTPDEQFRTYYYQGRIYQNQGDDDSAMISFMNACDLKQAVTDSLLLAHTFVAQGTLYLKQYKTKEFIQNNMAAAKLYGAIGRDLLEIKSYTNAIDGYVMLNNKTAADSLISICVPLVQKNQDGEAYLFPSLLSYTVEFCTPADIKSFLDQNQDLDLTKDDKMNFAQGYSKIGDYGKAMKLLSEITPDRFTLDSLKYASVKIDILEKQGNYEQALNLYKDYSAMLERYQKELLSHDLLFADLLDKAKSQKLKELKISAIQVTIDGLEKVHNERRPHKQNNDSFQRIVHNLDDLFSVYPEISIEFRVNVDKSNQSEYHRIYNYLKERYGKYSINIHPGYVTDDFSAESNGCCFEADEVNKFVLEQYDTHNIPISLYPRPIFGECSARHITSFVIGPEGELYKCWNDIGIKGKTIGTVKNVSLSHELLLKYLLENDPLSDANCERCFCFPICEGGCPYKRIYQKDSQERFCKAKREGIVENLKRHIDYKIKNNR